jgi:hypothetical protein
MFHMKQRAQIAPAATKETTMQGLGFMTDTDFARFEGALQFAFAHMTTECLEEYVITCNQAFEYCYDRQVMVTNAQRLMHGLALETLATRNAATKKEGK